MTTDHEVSVSTGAFPHVGQVTFSRPPVNFLDVQLLEDLVAGVESLRRAPVRAIVVASGGKHFCAGANLEQREERPDAAHLYEVAARLLDQPIPLVAAVQGTATGAGLGLAALCDFRVGTPGSRFVAPFAHLGIHHGFGLSETLPAVVGAQFALEMLLTCRPVDGAEALAVGLCDRLAPSGDVTGPASAFAAEIASSAPLAVRAIRRTMRGELADRFRSAVAHERNIQDGLFATPDAAEGMLAVRERRTPTFTCDTTVEGEL